MKKKNLIILLLIPFIISLLGIITINVTFNLIDNDILGINWNYGDVEGFKVDGKFRLEAKAIQDSKYPVSMGNQLVWKVENKDLNEEPHAEIKYEGNAYYLYTYSSGEVIITCSNEKGNVFKQMTAVIFSDGAIIINPKIKSSQNNIDSTIYYGEYDIVNNAKVKASIEYDIKTIPEDFVNEIYIKDSTNNVFLDLSNGKISVINDGDVSITLAHKAGRINDSTLNFKVVKDGVNVYTYDDLLYCTNDSENGEIVCLRKNFESLANIRLNNDNNVELFGHYDQNSQKYSFKDEVYSFETTFNQEYIQQWNEFAKTKKDYNEIDNIVYSGLHIQKDFYGNGYTLNLHNLTYPYSSIKVNGDDGSVYEVPTLTNDNIFRGPLPFYTLGDPNGLPLITAFGQDNSGMYVEGNNILINDINLKNCDFGNILANLTYVGNVMEVYGNNITIKNSRLANGKNVLRSFSSMNVNVDNCMLSNSRNFLITSGSNEYEKVDGSLLKDFKTLSNENESATISDYLSANATGDKIVTSYISGDFESKEVMREAILDIDLALNDESKVKNNYKGSMEISNSLFYQSGISSIALETYFNGPYLFSNSPSLIGSMFSQMSYEDKPLVPLEAKNVSGVSYPVKINISKDTRFYDFKKLETFDISGLISENISDIANSIFDQDIRKITIDDIFPIKSLLINAARSNGNIYTHQDENGNSSQYINVPIAYYGGGLNNSIVTYQNYDNQDFLSKDLPINLLDSYLTLSQGSGTMAMMKNLMVKTVTTVTGCSPFKFVCTCNNGVLLQETFNQSPNIETLKKHAKGE